MMFVLGALMGLAAMAVGYMIGYTEALIDRKDHE